MNNTNQTPQKLYIDKAGMYYWIIDVANKTIAKQYQYKF